MKKKFSLLLLTFILYSCSNSHNASFRNYYGEVAEITFNQKKIIEQKVKEENEKYVYLKKENLILVELLNIKDSNLIVRYIDNKLNQNIVIIGFDIINTLHLVDMDIESSKKTEGLIWCLAWDVISMIILKEVAFFQVFYGGLIPLTILAFINSGSEFQYKLPFTDTDIERLKLYCRYPMGLSPEQLENLLKYYNQKELKEFKFRSK